MDLYKTWKQPVKKDHMIKCGKFKRFDNDIIYEIYKIDGMYIHVKWNVSYSDLTRNRPIRKSDAKKLIDKRQWIFLHGMHQRLKRII